jgi:predicted small secreted protein
MKTIKIIALFIVLMSVFLTGCKSTDPNGAGMGDSAYPLDKSYPVEGYPVYDYGADGNMSYPVYPIDATQLTKVPTWTLVGYWVNSIQEVPGDKTFTFTSDGGYTLTTDNGVEEGQWYVTTTTEPLLVLNTGTEQNINYVIVNLTSDSMVLTIEQDGAFIEEQYQPAD